MIQYLVCHKADGPCDRGIEGDNNPDAPNHQPRSKPEIYNATIIGMDNQGILLRNGSAGTITNCITMNCGRAGLMVDLISANNQNAVDGMSFMHIIFSNNKPDLSDSAKKIAHAPTTLIIQPQLRDTPNWDWRPRPTSPALHPANANLSVSPFIGAISTDDWTAGWVRRRTKRLSALPKAGNLDLHCCKSKFLVKGQLNAKSHNYGA